VHKDTLATLRAAPNGVTGSQLPRSHSGLGIRRSTEINAVSRTMNATTPPKIPKNAIENANKGSRK